MKHGELPLGDTPRNRYRLQTAKHYKLVALREWQNGDELKNMDSPEHVVRFYREFVQTGDDWTHEVEQMHVFCVNVRRRCTGYFKVGGGTIDTLLVHPREIFRPAIVENAAAVILCHNHPSGDPTPSEADIKFTRDMIRAGQVVKIEVLDSLVIGNPRHCSLREQGYFSF